MLWGYGKPSPVSRKGGSYPIGFLLSALSVVGVQAGRDLGVSCSTQWSVRKDGWGVFHLSQFLPWRPVETLETCGSSVLPQERVRAACFGGAPGRPTLTASETAEVADPALLQEIVGFKHSC